MNSTVKGLLAVILMAPPLWFAVWALSVISTRLPINRSFKACIAAAAMASALLGTWFAQGKIYSSMTGVQIPTQDNYFFTVILGEALAALGLIFVVAFGLKKRESRKSDGLKNGPAGDVD